MSSLATKYIWNFPKTPIYYDLAYKKMLGVLDEMAVIDYLKNFGKSVVVVSLGIGTGRELKWLEKIKNISKIIGVDYSKAMLKFCQKRAQKCKKEVILLEEDIINPVKLKEKVLKIKEPIIYLSLVNTFGNSPSSERTIIAEKIRDLMKKEDRLILCLYKRIDKVAIDAIKNINIPPYLKIKSKEEKIKLAEIVEYALFLNFYPAIIERYKKPPMFWYEEKENDIAIYVGKEKVFISHRFSEEEIRKLGQKVNLKIEKLIGGKLMYIVIFRIK